MYGQWTNDLVFKNSKTTSAIKTEFHYLYK